MIKMFFGTTEDKNNQLLAAISSKKFSARKANFLLSRGASLDWENEKGENYFHIASKNNNILAMKWLLSKKVDINKENINKKTPIFYAFQSDSIETISFLINNGANKSHKNNFSRTLLHEAVIANKNLVIIYLLKMGLNINAKDDKGRSIIFDSVINGTKSLVDKISSLDGLDINLKDKNGNTAMHEKNVYTNPELAYTLMDNGADPTICDKNGRDFLFYIASACMENDKLIDRSIEQGCDINVRDKDNETVLMKTIKMLLSTDSKEEREKFFKLAQKFIDTGVDINAINNQGDSVLSLCVKSSDLEALQFILSQENINVDIQNNEGNTSLVLSISKINCDMPIITELLEAGASPNIADKNNATIIEKLIDIVLHLDNEKKLDKKFLIEIFEDRDYILILKEILAKTKVKLLNTNSKLNPIFFDIILYNNKNLFLILKEHGINLNQKDKNGENIAFRFIDELTTVKTQKKKREMLYSLKNLINSGVNINSKNKDGRTPVHEAILKGDEDTARVFIDAKPNLKLKDKKGRNAVHCCVWEGKVGHFRMISGKDKTVVNLPDFFGLLPIHYAAFMGKTPLVLKMIEAGSFVNSNRVINEKMIDYLRKFTGVLDTLEEDTRDAKEKVNLRSLTDNMKREFAL